MKSDPKAIILLSGGLDSAVNLSLAINKRNIVLNLIFDYGQKAAKYEIKAAKALSKFYTIPYEIIELDWLKNITDTSLVNKSEVIPKVTEKDFTSKNFFFETAKKVWVPNRNGVFINIAAAYAEHLQAKTIIVGFNKEEGVTFPDNSSAFLKAINQSLKYSTLKDVKVESFVRDLNKTEIVTKGLEQALPFKLIYSCYHGKEKMCGECESCQRLIRAIKQVNQEPLTKIMKKNFKRFY